MSDNYKHIKPNIPADYFEGFADRMMDQVVDEDSFDMQDSAPLLIAIGGQNGFRVPDGYFEHFKVDVEAQSFDKLIYLKRLSLAAASIILLIACLFVFKQNPAASDQLLVEETESEQLSDQEIFAAIDQDEFITDDILSESFFDFDAQLEDIDITELVESNLEEFELNELEILF